MRRCTSGSTSSWMRWTSPVRARRMMNPGPLSLTVPPYRVRGAALAAAGDDERRASSAQPGTRPGTQNCRHPSGYRQFRESASVVLRGEVRRGRAGADRGGRVDSGTDRLAAGGRREDELTVGEVDVDVVARVQLAVQDLLAQSVLD